MATPTTTGRVMGLTAELQQKILDFLWVRKTGNITLNVKDGHVLSWQFTEFGRVSSGSIDKVQEHPHTK